MYEKAKEPLAAAPLFARRVLRHTAVAAGVIVLSLAAGLVGYHHFEGLPWIDALLNASMLLGGMGPVDALHTTPGKLFASAYALYCGLVVILTTGILLAPFLHRLMHHFHCDPGRGS
jgi:hypothetical protein